MADNAPQSFENHAMFDPPFHYVLLPIFGLNFIYQCVEFVKFLMYGDGAWLRPLVTLILAFGFLLLTFKARIYSLKVQDRLIRLEERLRLASILPEPLRVRISELTEDQLIGLRFASDQEVAGLVQDALDKKLARKEIKKSVRNWRADAFRI
jgi:Family of unknown function (DUF6526)